MSGERGGVWRKTRGLRVRQKGAAACALVFAVGGVTCLVNGDDTEMGVILAVSAVTWGLSSLREPPPPAKRVFGSGPLAPSGTGRFRVSGWPPSKNPDDYR